MDAAVQQNMYHEKLLMYRNVRMPQSDQVRLQCYKAHTCKFVCSSTIGNDSIDTSSCSASMLWQGVASCFEPRQAFVLLLITTVYASMLLLRAARLHLSLAHMRAHYALIDFCRELVMHMTRTLCGSPHLVCKTANNQPQCSKYRCSSLFRKPHLILTCCLMVFSVEIQASAAKASVRDTSEEEAGLGAEADLIGTEVVRNEDRLSSSGTGVEEGGVNLTEGDPRLALLWEWQCPLAPSASLSTRVTCMAWNKVHTHIVRSNLTSPQLVTSGFRWAHLHSARQSDIGLNNSSLQPGT